MFQSENGQNEYILKIFHLQTLYKLKLALINFDLNL